MIRDSKIAQKATSDRCWAELREKKDDLIELVDGSRPPDPFDFILFFQCLTLVLTDIMLYEEEFLNDEMEEMLTDQTPAGVLIRIGKETSYWSSLEDKNNTSSTRLESLERLRKTVWGQLVYKKNAVIELIRDYPTFTDTKEIALFLHCLSVVILEIDLKQREIVILEESC